MEQKNQIWLRPLADPDIGLIATWLPAPHIRRWFEHPAAWLEEIEGRHLKYSFIQHFIPCIEEEPIGFCQYYDCSATGPGQAWSCEPPGTFGIDFFIGLEILLGKGLGSELVKIISLAAAKEATATQLIADPDPANIASIKSLIRNNYIFDPETSLYKLPSAHLKTAL